MGLKWEVTPNLPQEPHSFNCGSSQQLLNAKEEISDEMKATGFFEWSIYTSSWLFNRKVWSRKIRPPYVKEHYQFIEKEYEINTK